jgi:rhomboid protease GluP
VRGGSAYNPPVTDEAPPETSPYALVPHGWLAGAPVSKALIFANVGVYVAQVAIARTTDAVMRIPAHESLQFGANYAAATLRDHRFETLVTSMFLHAGLIHLAFNMIVLLQAGPLVEYVAGAARMLPLYLFAGIVSAAFSALAPFVSPSHDLETFSVGASGAIMGVLAAALVLGWRRDGWKGALTQAMLRWLGFNLVFGFLANAEGANIDNAAHIGGALAGGLVALAWKGGVVREPLVTRRVVGACAAFVAVCALIVAARGAADPYAAQTGDERLRHAAAAIDAGDCHTAHDALVSVERIYPDEPHVREQRKRFNAYCGRPI